MDELGREAQFRPPLELEPRLLVKIKRVHQNAVVIEDGKKIVGSAVTWKSLDADQMIRSRAPACAMFIVAHLAKIAYPKPAGRRARYPGPIFTIACTAGTCPTS